jgi:hypothetical protein
LGYRGIAKIFFRYGKPYNPPCPPFNKGGLDRIDSGAEGEETIGNGEVKRGRRLTGLRGFEDAIKKRPSCGGMTFMAGVSEMPKLLAYLCPIQPCTRVSSPDGLARLPAWARPGLGDKVRDRVNAAPKTIRATPFDLNGDFPHDFPPQFFNAFTIQGGAS